MIRPSNVQIKSYKDQIPEAKILKVENTKNKLVNTYKNTNTDVNKINKLPSSRLNFDKKLQEKNLHVSNIMRNDDPKIILLFEYLCNLGIFCKKKVNKSLNFRLISSIAKIYEDYLSVEDIIKRRFEIDAIITEIYKRFEYKIEDFIKDNMKSYIISQSN